MLNFKNLDVWNVSMYTVKKIYELTKRFPVDEKFGLISQTNRAAVSIPSNIAEGLGRNYKKDTIQFIHISRGSAYELETLLNIAFMVDFITEPKFTEYENLINKNIQIINGFIKYLEQKS